jgi:hypothetical protein
VQTSTAPVTRPIPTALRNAITVESVNIEAFIQQNHFADISAESWYVNHVAFVTLAELMVGTEPGQFSPQLTVTRSMVVQVLFNLEGRPGIEGLQNIFLDVPTDNWYHDAVTWAASEGIVSGHEDGNFRPGDHITRAHLAIILNNYLNLLDIQLPQQAIPTAFTDDEIIPNYARSAINTLNQAGIITGRPDGSFDPQATATRAELSAMLHRFVEAIAQVVEL